MILLVSLQLCKKKVRCDSEGKLYIPPIGIFCNSARRRSINANKDNINKAGTGLRRVNDWLIYVEQDSDL